MLYVGFVLMRRDYVINIDPQLSTLSLTVIDGHHAVLDVMRWCQNNNHVVLVDWLPWGARVPCTIFAADSLDCLPFHVFIMVFAKM